MATIVHVKAANVSKFWHNPDVKGYTNFPETTKTYPMNWSFDEHRFLFDLPDGEIIELAKKSKLSYEDGEDKGKAITTFDLNHREDPFFNHSRLRIKITDDITTFNTKNPLEKLLLSGFKTYPFVAKSESDKTNVASVKWVIIDKELEAADKERGYLNEKTVWKFFTGTDKERLTPSMMRNILFAFNDKAIAISDTTAPEALEALLMSKIKEPKHLGKMSNKEKFLVLATSSKEELEIRALMGKALQRGIVRKTGEKWFYAGNKLADSTEATVQFLKKPENSAVYVALKEEVEFKK